MGIPRVTTADVFLLLQLLSTLWNLNKTDLLFFKTAHIGEYDPDNKTQGLPATPFLGQIIVNTTIYLWMTSSLKTCRLQLGLETSHSHGGDQVMKPQRTTELHPNWTKTRQLNLKGTYPWVLLAFQNERTSKDSVISFWPASNLKQIQSFQIQSIKNDSFKREKRKGSFGLSISFDHFFTSV